MVGEDSYITRPSSIHFTFFNILSEILITMRFSLMLALATLTLALPDTDPLANPFALDPRSVGGKCSHSVSSSYTLSGFVYWQLQGIKGTCEKSCQGGFQTVGDCPNGISSLSLINKDRSIDSTTDPTNVKCCMHVACTDKASGIVGSCRNFGTGNCVGGRFQPWVYSFMPIWGLSVCW